MNGGLIQKSATLVHVSRTPRTEMKTNTIMPGWKSAKTAELCRGVAKLLVSVLCAVTALAAEPTAARPNILFIFSDDHSCQSIGAYRTWLSGFIREQNITPNIDRLADQGAIFDRSSLQIHRQIR